MSFAGKYGSDPAAPAPKGPVPKSKKKSKAKSSSKDMRGANQRRYPAKKGEAFTPSDSLVSMRAC